ncbi:MAG: ABC transporter permease [bacterium]|nr:ABC transporter permease [bacterium]
MPIGVLLSLNANLRSNLAFALATIASIAASVALATGMEMTSRTARVNLDRSAKALAGESKIELVSGLVGIPEKALEIAAATPGVALASPLFEATFTLASDGTPIRILGLDLVAEKELREYEIERAGVRIRDPLRLLARPESIIITQPLSVLAGLELGDKMPVLFEGRSIELVVEGMLRPGGVADAFAGQVGVMDVYSLAHIVGREGWFDRIDIVPEQGVSPASLIEELDRQLGGIAEVRLTSSSEDWRTRTASAIRLTALIASAVAGAAACILCYSAISLSVSRRYRELEVLRALGCTRKFIRGLLWADCIAFSIVGVAIGLFLGLIVAQLVAGSVSILAENHDSLQESDIYPNWATALVALAVGLGASIAGLLSSIRAASSNTESRAGTVRLFRNLARAASSLAPGIGHLVGSGLASRPRTAALTGLSLAAVAVAIVIISTLTESFGESLARHAVGRFPEAIYVTAGTPFEASHLDHISGPGVEAIENSPQVRKLAPVYAATLLYEGQEVRLSAESLDNSSALKGNRAECARAGLGAERVGVSFAFSRRFDIAIGDSVTLKTPQGVRDYHVVCRSRAFAGPSGEILMDSSTYIDLWKPRGMLFMVVWPVNSIDELIVDLRARTAGVQPLFFVDAAALREFANKAVSRFDGTRYTISSLALVLGGIAVANSLIGISAARRREFVLLVTAGATSSQITAIVLSDGLLLATGGLVTGVPLGLILSVPLSNVVGSAFGWPLTPYVDPMGIAAIVGATFAIVTLASIPAAVLTRREL